jgi:hypothetical protein
MKAWKISLLTAVLLLVGSCQEFPPTPAQNLAQSGFSLEFFRDGYYKAVLPNWEESQELEPESIHLVTKQGQLIGVNRYQSPPEVVLREFLSSVEQNSSTYLVQQSQMGGKPFIEYTTRENDQTLRIQAVLDYCQGHTYALFAGGRDTLENADLFEEVLTSSTCQDPFQVPDLETGKIGLRVNSAGDEPLSDFYPALRLAKENGVQVIHTYIQWGDVEPAQGPRVWDWQDILIGYPIREGFEVSLVINVIHTSVKGPMPADLDGKEFDDPDFIQRFSDFVLEVLDRYPVQYLSIGNEVNDYFVSHRNEIPAYRTFFLAVQDRIHQQHPDVQVGMSFAYHDAESTNAVDIIEQLDLGDFLPLTLYIYSSGFQFDHEPDELDAYLDRILALAGDKQIAIIETGWNTAESLSGSQADQEIYLREVFSQLEENREQIAFISWFDLHDSLLENSSQAALTFLPTDSSLADDEEFMEKFVAFLNYFGLRESDGTPKLAWYAFQEEANAYLESLGADE